MKILMVNDNDPDEVVGGSERYILDVTRELEAAGHQVSWFTLSAAGGKDRPETHARRRVFAVDREHGVRWLLRHALLYKALWKALKDFLSAVEPDVVHLHNNYRYPLTVLAATRGLRVVQTVHDYCLVYPTAYCTQPRPCTGSVFAALRHGCMNWKLLVTEGWLLYGRRFLDPRFVHRFIAPSRDLASQLRQRLGSTKVRNLGNFRSLPDAWASTIPESRVVLYVGALIAHKGVGVLLDAYAAIAKEFADTELWIVGDGPERHELETSAAASGTRRVRFRGQLGERELADVYRRSRLVVIPSLWLENAPLVAIEAMAHGRPLVVSRVGGLPELVEDGGTGLTFARGDATDLAAKIRTLLTDQTLAQRLALAGRKRYEETGLPARHLHALTALYREGS